MLGVCKCVVSLVHFCKEWYVGMVDGIQLSDNSCGFPRSRQGSYSIIYKDMTLPQMVWSHVNWVALQIISPHKVTFKIQRIRSKPYIVGLAYLAVLIGIACWCVQIHKNSIQPMYQRVHLLLKLICSNVLLSNNEPAISFAAFFPQCVSASRINLKDPFFSTTVHIARIPAQDPINLNISISSRTPNVAEVVSIPGLKLMRFVFCTGWNKNLVIAVSGIHLIGSVSWFPYMVEWYSCPQREKGAIAKQKIISTPKHKSQNILTIATTFVQVRNTSHTMVAKVPASLYTHTYSEWVVYYFTTFPCWADRIPSCHYPCSRRVPVQRFFGFP